MRLSTLCFTLLAFATSPALAATERYEFDKQHTNILFFINHLGFSDMVGEFTSYDGQFTFDPAKPENSSVDVTLKPTGIRTSSEALDKELQNDKFFNSEKFPEIHFKSREIKPVGEKTGDVTGDLTLLGVTKPVVLHVRFNKADYHPMTGSFIAGFQAEATIKRSDFGMNSFIPMVGDDVRILIQTEGVNIDREKKTGPKPH